MCSHAWIFFSFLFFSLLFLSFLKTQVRNLNQVLILTEQAHLAPEPSPWPKHTFSTDRLFGAGEDISVVLALKH